MSIKSQVKNRKKIREIKKKTLYLKIIKPKNEINEEDKRNADRISKSEGWKTVIQSPLEEALVMIRENKRRLYNYRK